MLKVLSCRKPPLRERRLSRYSGTEADSRLTVQTQPSKARRANARTGSLPDRQLFKSGPVGTDTCLKHLCCVTSCSTGPSSAARDRFKRDWHRGTMKTGWGATNPARSFHDGSVVETFTAPCYRGTRPVNGVRSPCSAGMSPCYGGTGQMPGKALKCKKNISNKVGNNRARKKRRPVRPC